MQPGTRFLPTRADSHQVSMRRKANEEARKVIQASRVWTRAGDEIPSSNSLGNQK